MKEWELLFVVFVIAAVGLLEWWLGPAVFLGMAVSSAVLCVVSGWREGRTPADEAKP